MIKEDLISVIVPIYNVEKYLDRCVKSIVEQTYDNIEIILVDDGATDNSGVIADLWGTRDERILVYHKKNGGLSDARNYGTKKSKGKYICYIDSDDYVSEKFVECLYKTLINSTADIACVGLQEFTDKIDPKVEDYSPEKTEVFGREEAISYLYGSEKYQNYAWNKIYLKDLFDDVEYPMGRKMEDLGTTYLLFDKCNKVSYNPAKLYYYYQREDSILHQVNEQFCIDQYHLSKQRYLYVTDKYPELQVAYTSFFIDCLWLIPYQSSDENEWSKNELDKLWPKVKKEVSLKHALIYGLYKYANQLYLRKYKKC